MPTEVRMAPLRIANEELNAGVQLRQHVYRQHASSHQYNSRRRRATGDERGAHEHRAGADGGDEHKHDDEARYGPRAVECARSPARRAWRTIGCSAYGAERDQSRVVHSLAVPVVLRRVVYLLLLLLRSSLLVVERQYSNCSFSARLRARSNAGGPVP